MTPRPCLATPHGPALPAEPAPFWFPRQRAQLLELAGRIDREADQCLFEGHGVVADRLSHLAIELRARAGARA